MYFKDKVYIRLRLCKMTPLSYCTSTSVNKGFFLEYSEYPLRVFQSPSKFCNVIWFPD